MAIRRLMLIGSAAVLLASIMAGTLFSDQPKPLPFKPGETLTYDVSWSIFHAGQVVAKLERDNRGPNDSYAVNTTATSTGFVSLLYKVQDHFRSVFNPQTLCSDGIQKKINEGRRHKETDIVFDASRRLAILSERNLAAPRDPVNHKQNAIPACTEDVVSAFYYLRSQPMRVGQKIDLAINDGSKTKDVVADVEAREHITTPLGSFEAFRVEPSVFGGLYKRKGRMLIWFSDDARHLPLRIKAEISVGAITGTLTSVSGGEPDTPAKP